ncbi:MAG: hypothetical protein WBP64_01635 [Nitrososphaeraceae archaeon]|jgi:hypothetical protein
MLTDDGQYEESIPMSNTKVTVLVIILITLELLLLLPTKTPFTNQEVSAEQVQQPSNTTLPDIITVQNTSMSVPAPNAPINNQSIPHQIVVALPIRQDGKIWVGTATFTASKPIEVEVEHKYNPKMIPDVKRGAPLNARWIDNATRIALSTMTIFSNTPVTITNTPISTGSFTFAGSALVFHKTDGQPFTVTYTLDAMAKPLTQR